MDSKGKSNSSMAKVVGKAPASAKRPGLSKAPAIKLTHSHNPKPTDRRMASEPAHMSGMRGKG